MISILCSTIMFAKFWMLVTVSLVAATSSLLRNGDFETMLRWDGWTCGNCIGSLSHDSFSGERSFQTSARYVYSLIFIPCIQYFNDVVAACWMVSGIMFTSNSLIYPFYQPINLVLYCVQLCDCNTKRYTKSKLDEITSEVL